MPERKKNKRASRGKNCGSSAPSLDLTLLIAVLNAPMLQYSTTPSLRLGSWGNDRSTAIGCRLSKGLLRKGPNTPGVDRVVRTLLGSPHVPTLLPMDAPGLYRPLFRTVVDPG